MAQKTISTTTKTQVMPLSWQDNPAIKDLLDIIITILAEQYIQVAKENKELFTKEKRKI
jgi:hypothetical protein